MVVIIEKEKELSPLLKHMKLKFTSIYFANYLDDHDQKKTTLTIEAPYGISRDQIKQVEGLTNTRFTKVDIRESPLLGYQTVCEIVFARA